jgi:hypothetical protein
VAGRTREAVRLLAGDPQIGPASVFAAAALSEAGLAGEFIAADPALAVGLDDDRGWPPLLYACYSHWHLVVVVVPREDGEGFGAVAGDRDGVEDDVFLECPDGEVPVVRVVLDDHDLLVIHGCPPR